MIPKFPLVDNMRQYGGNFVSKLADAMVAADPENLKILVEAFPQIVGKYTESEAVSEEDCIREQIDKITPSLGLLESEILGLDANRARLCQQAEPLREDVRKLESRLYIIQNGITKEQIHFSAPDANGGAWFNIKDDFIDHLRSFPRETRKKFAEWNGQILWTSTFSATPANVTELEDRNAF
jgi:hypothetical protein